MRHRCPWRAIAPHHIQYADPEKGIPEIVALLYNSEHRPLTTVLRLGRSKKTKVSRAFMEQMSKGLYALGQNNPVLSEEQMNLELAENHRKRLERKKRRRKK